MKDNNNYEFSKKSREDVEAIKNDIKDIAKRVGNLKSEALTMLYEDSNELMSNLGHVKDKIKEQGHGKLCGLYSQIEANPLKAAAYCFGAGVILAMLWSRK